MTATADQTRDRGAKQPVTFELGRRDASVHIRARPDVARVLRLREFDTRSGAQRSHRVILQRPDNRRCSCRHPVLVRADATAGPKSHKDRSERLGLCM